MGGGGVNLLLPQARGRGRKSWFLAKEWRLFQISRKVGEQGGGWSSEDLGLHLLLVYIFARVGTGSPRIPLGYLCLCCSPGGGQTGRIKALHSTAHYHPLPSTAFERPSEETLFVTLLTDGKTEARTRKQGHSSVTRTHGSSLCSKTQPKGNCPRPLGIPGVLVNGGNMFDLPARTCGLRDVAGSAKP